MRTVIKGIKRTSLRNLRDTQISPSLRIPQGVQALFLGLLTSFGLGVLVNHSAYAAYSASISRTSSGTITLSDGSGSSIKPSSTGTLGTGSDTVSVSSNCTAGYNLYVSAISGGSTNLSTDGGTDYIPSTTTATGSETALSKDTWGVGKNGSTFSKLPAYSTDASTWTALYTGTGDSSSTKQNYTVYYGANVSTAKTPGTYTGDVLYTVIMNSACEKYTLKFDDDGATTINLEDQQIAFDAEINLADISSTDKIAKTGYHLTGWKDQNNNSYGITGKADVNPNDLSVVTLTAQWTKNSYAVTVNKGTNVSTVTGAGTYNYGSAVSVAATAFETGYHFSSWTVNSGGVTLYSNSAMTTQSTTSTPAYFSMPNNAVTVTANAAANTYTIKYAAGSTGGSCSVSDTSATYDQDVKLSDTVCTKSGAEQKGWAADPSGSPKSYDLGATLIKPNLTSTNGGSVTLYPYFESSVASMQNFTCSGSGLTTGQSMKLVDARDNKTYTVKKLPDGKCWMMQNLTIGSTGAQTLTSANTNIDDGKTYYLPPAGKQGSSTIDDSSTLTATDTANFTSDAAIDKHAKTQFRTKGTPTNDSDTGYYNFYTATLGFSSYNDGKTVGTSSRDICPAGWRLPKVSATATTTSGSRDFTGDFAVLASSYNSGASWTNGTTENRYTSDTTIKNKMYLVAASPLATTTGNDNAGFSYSGLWSGTDSSASNVGSYGYYWSSSVSDTYSGYYLYFNSSDIYPQRSNLKGYGRAVRCVAKS